MEKSMKGQIVVIPFPFSDLSGAKKRPALVIADWGGADIMCCQITSKSKFDGIEINLRKEDFDSGELTVESNIRPNKIFTADKKNVISIAGKISSQKYSEVINQISKLIS